MLACALEPLSDKSGCTTRHRDISSYQKLEYFVAGAINIGEILASSSPKLFSPVKIPVAVNFADCECYAMVIQTEIPI